MLTRVEQSIGLVHPMKKLEIVIWGATVRALAGLPGRMRRSAEQGHF